MSDGGPSPLRLRAVVVDPERGVRVGVPEGWVVEMGPPVVVQPAAWDGEPPAVVVSAAADDLRGERLAEAVAYLAATRLTDPVVIDVAIAPAGDVEIVVAHRSRGVDVTTVERHHSGPDGWRWVVGFTAADADVVDLAPVMQQVVGSLALDPSPS